MTRSSTAFTTTLALAGSLAILAGHALAQTDGRATTRSLNTGPAQSVLNPRPNAQSPLAAPRQARPAPAPSRTLEDLLGETRTPAEDTAPEGVTLGTGQTEPDPIPMTLGYYVRGEMACDQAWPGQGDLAFATPTAFTLDYGGCEPGPWLQTGPNSWREDQRCITESGGDAGGYSVTYEVIGLDVVLRTARLAIDDSQEQDRWHHCRAEDLSENARFMS
ncbi:MAG: hypothetical protein K2X25_16645 [Caulobacteraceae bacterium]|nr:hypothetical protein [Caulobacteraceae bacterium]